MPALTFDGIDITHYAYVQLERQPAPSLRVETRDVPGRGGVVALGATRDVTEITAHCLLRPRYVDQWDTLRRTILARLLTDSPRVLVLPDEDGMYRYATASFTSTVTEPLEPPVTFDITFTDHDSILYGMTHIATIPSGGSAGIVVDGTLPPAITIVADNAVRNASSNVWGVRFDDGDFLHVATKSNSARKVEIDCDKRTCKLAGAAYMVTPDSNWPELSAGPHTVVMSFGTGAATLTWVERWL